MAVSNLSPCAKEFNAVKCLEFVFSSVKSFFRWNRQKLKLQASSNFFFHEAYCYEEETIHPFLLVYQKIYLLSNIGVSIFINCFLSGSALYP